MLTRFTVKGFKSLLDTSVELSVVNVFIGANGSGKSNILEALGVMGAAVFGFVEPETLRYRGVRPGLPSLYKSSFKDKPFEQPIKLDAQAREVTYRLDLDNPIESPAMRWKISKEFLAYETQELLIHGPSGTQLYPPNGPLLDAFEDDESVAKLSLNYAKLKNRDAAVAARSLLSDLESFAIFAPNTSVLRGLATDVTREPLGLEGSGLPKAIQDLLDASSEVLGPFDLSEIWELIEWAEDMSAVPGSELPVSPAVPTTPLLLKFVDRFMRPGRNTLSGYDASEGALYVLFLLALVSHPRAPRLFAVDNFDHALHPRLAASLTRMVTQQLIEDGSRQMLLTTHNPLVLDGLDLRDDRIRLFAVERNSGGQTEIHRIELSEDLLAEAEKGMSLSRLWVMGRLGAVPRNL